MRLISPPPEQLATVARQLLASADLLGLAPETVATTTGAEFGYGFTVPDELFDHWFLRLGEPAVTATAMKPKVFSEPTGPVVPFEDEFPEAPETVTPEVPEVSEAPVPEVPEKPKRGKRGTAATTEEEV